HVHYLYDGSGQRVKKLARKRGGQTETATYVEARFERRRVSDGVETQHNDTLHVMDGQQRIALLRAGAPLPGDTTPIVAYEVGDHLASVNVVVESSGAFVDREEYTPYGETSFGSFAKKRYRFSGKERDEESGLAYFGARYHASWIARWTSSDPAGPV